MKQIISLLAAIVTVSVNSFSQFTLRIEITDLKNNTGNIMLQVFDGKEKIIKQETGDIKEKSYYYTVKNLSQGKYAVRFYHDENMNQVMETNMVGKPTEGYGFSNNVTGKFAMPSFEKWLFDLREDTTILIKAVY